jgi:hypothetical protein
MSSTAQKKDSERRGPSRRQNERRGEVAPPSGGVERREELDRRGLWRRASDTPYKPSEEEYARWAGALRSLGPQITRCVQLTEFVDEAPELIVRIRSATKLEDWEQVVALAGNLERAGLRISSSHVSHDARRVQHEVASMPQHGSVAPALDSLEVAVKRTSKMINEALDGGLPA